MELYCVHLDLTCQSQSDNISVPGVTSLNPEKDGFGSVSLQ